MNQQVEDDVISDIVRRQQLGVNKLKQWLQHAYEECLDQAIYLKRAMRELKVDE